jgi:signal transduction histidine kinase
MSESRGGHAAPSRVDRVIAGGRVALALSSLLAISTDPSAPAAYASTTYTLLIAYAIHAFTLLCLLLMPLSLPRHWPLGTHLIDLAVFSLLMFFTQGPTSPFFVFFVFSIVCATLRWGTFGTLWTSVIAISVFLSLGVYATQVLADPAFDLHVFLIRAVYLAVVATAVGYLGLHGQRAHREIASLASWPRIVVGEKQAVVRDALDRVATVLRARRVLLVWEQPDEPSTNVAVWDDGAFEWTREPPNLVEPGGSASPASVRLSGLASRYPLRAAPSWTVRGQGAEGELFFLDGRRLTVDEVALGEVAARLTAATLDSLYLLIRLREAVASEQRVRLARNLHDSVLQSLTGIALQLQSARQLLGRDPRAGQARLREMQETLAGEQHRLRNFIKDLRPFATSDPTDRSELSVRLSDLCRRIERQWGMRVELAVPDSGLENFAPLHQDVYYLVNEALINAARHARASWVSVAVVAGDSEVRIEVVDDGHGFPFSGRYDLGALQKMSAGPGSLKDRIVGLSGQLEIDSSATGARLIMTLPVDQTSAPVSTTAE